MAQEQDDTNVDDITVKRVIIKRAQKSIIIFKQDIFPQIMMYIYSFS